MELPTRYDPKDAERRWYDFWEQHDFFRAEIDLERSPYTIMIPPPNVTAILHMGQAFNLSFQDILSRYWRMRGRTVLWLPGVDHAGIATQNVVERELAAEGKGRKDLGREAFVARVWDWKRKYGDTIVQQIRRLGSSCDWSRERFTMDEGLSRAVYAAFEKLYKDGLIFRGKYIVNWCPRCETALADDEVEHEQKTGSLWHIRYPLKDGDGHLVVATTRPETMLGDTAVAVDPKDPRYKKLVGKKAVLPIVGRELEIIADRAVDAEFGTGAVKVTPAHDPNDFAIGQRHDLERVIVMDETATMNEQAKHYNGMDRYTCREKLVEELKQLDLLEKVVEHEHAVGTCYRCQTVIEPYLSDQWFVDLKAMAAPAIEATRSGKVRFHPERWSNYYLSWLENARPWCISRQIWWGHRIPVYYCDGCGEQMVASEAPDACVGCGSKELRQDEDVLDTWFSSALWPFSTLGWPDQTKDLDYFYPTSTLVTDRGIIFFWVARMVMMGLKLAGDIPFTDVYINGTICDETGRKMSKSLGNGIDPLEMIDRFGADALRYSMMTLTSEGQDVKLAATKFEMGRNFANKIWNAARFALMNLEGNQARTKLDDVALTLEDRWILSRLNRVVEEYSGAIEAYKFNEAARFIYTFAWHELCDWYLELVKPRMQNEPEKTGALTVVAHVLDKTLRLLHPLLPFLTEETWQTLKKTVTLEDAAESIMVADWPIAEESRIDPEVEEILATLIEITTAIRRIKRTKGVAEGKPVEVLIAAPDAARLARIEEHTDFFVHRAGASRVTCAVGLARPDKAVAEVVGDWQVFVPLEGLIDRDEEIARLTKKIEEVTGHLEASKARLANESFVSRAPSAVVEQARTQQADLEEQVAKLQANLDEM